MGAGCFPVFCLVFSRLLLVIIILWFPFPLAVCLTSYLLCCVINPNSWQKVTYITKYICFMLSEQGHNTIFRIFSVFIHQIALSDGKRIFFFVNLCSLQIY